MEHMRWADRGKVRVANATAGFQRTSGASAAGGRLIHRNVDGGGDARTPTGRRLDRERAADRRKPVRHVDQPVADSRGIESFSGIADYEVELLVVAGCRHRDRGIGPPCLAAFVSASLQQ